MRQPSALRLALAGMWTLAVAIGIGRFAFTPILPMMQEQVGLSLSTAAWLASANYAGYLAGALSAVWLRANSANLVRAGLLATALLTAGMGLTHSPALWFLLRGLAGITSAWMLIFASALILPLLSALGRGRFGGIVFGGVGLGITLAGSACLMFEQWSWSSDRAWVALGGIALLITVGIWPVYRSLGAMDGQSQGGAQTAAREPFAWRAHWLLVFCYGVFGFGYIIPATFLPAMAKQIIADPGLFGWAWPIFGSAALLSTLAAGWLSARVSSRSIWISGQATMAVGVLLPVLSRSAPAIVICALCVGGTFVVTTMAGMQEARRVAADHAARLMAAMTAAFAAGQILGPALLALVARLPRALDAVLIAAGALLVLSAIALFRIDRREARSSAPGA